MRVPTDPHQTMLTVSMEGGSGMADRPDTVTCEECGGPVKVAPRGALPKRHAPGKCEAPQPAPDTTGDADKQDDATPGPGPDVSAEPAGPTITRVQVAPYAYEEYHDGVLVGRHEGCAG